MVMRRKFATALPEQQRVSAPAARVTPACSPQSKSSLSILQLQRMLGNQHVAQLIQAKRLTSQGTISAIQPKLTVGAANDQYEQEADRVARQVTSMSDPAANLQRGISSEEDKDKGLQAKPLADAITPVLQRDLGNRGKIGNEEEDKKKVSVQAKSTDESIEIQRQPEIRLNLYRTLHLPKTVLMPAQTLRLALI
jgi:hypothetical protein